MNKWEVKNSKEKKYKTKFGKTDYDIPMISYKGALFITLSIVISAFIYPKIFKDRLLISYICSGITIGFSISYSQYYISSKQKNKTKFFIVGILMSLFTMFILLIF